MEEELSPTSDALVPTGTAQQQATAKDVPTRPSQQWEQNVPMCTDIIRNNVRSRTLLLLSYGFLVIVVLYLAFTYFVPTTERTYSLHFVVYPPKSVVIGEQWDTFSVQLLDSRSNVVRDEPLSLSVFPVEATTLKSVLDDDRPYPLRSFRCVTTILANPDNVRQEEEFYCLTNYLMEIRNGNNVATNEYGVAEFSGTNMTFGSSGLHLMIVSPRRAKFGNIFLQHFFSLEDRVIDLQNVSTLGLPSNNEITIGNGFSVSVEIAVQADVPPVKLGVAVVAMSLQTFDNESQPVSVLDPLAKGELTDKKAVLANAFLRTSNFVKSATRGSGFWWVATALLSNVSILGTNAKRLFVGVACGGVVTPLLRFLTPHHYPPAFYRPLSVVSAVTNVSLSNVSTYDVVEVMTPLRVFVRVFHNSTPLSDKVVWVELQASNENLDFLHRPEWSHPKMNGKRITSSISARTDAMGWASFEIYFSSAGAVGKYVVTFVCDGVSSDPLVVEIRSSVHFVALFTPEGPWSTSNTETVSVPWVETPLVCVFDANNYSISGKMAVVQSRAPGAVAQGVSFAGTEDGCIHFKSVVVPYSNFSGLCIFDFYVDDLLVGSVNKTLVYPDSMPLTTCSFGEIDSVPALAFSGLPNTVKVITPGAEWKPKPFLQPSTLWCLPLTLQVLSRKGI